MQYASQLTQLTLHAWRSLCQSARAVLVSVRSTEVYRFLLSYVQLSVTVNSADRKQIAAQNLCPLSAHFMFRFKERTADTNRRLSEVAKTLKLTSFRLKL